MEAESELELDLPSGTEVDGYIVKRLLGEGATGWVFLAQDVQLGRAVALKFIRGHQGGHFLEEARATARFNHPNIVTLYAASTWKSVPYLALEYVDGENLRHRLKAGPIPLREALRLAGAIADAITEAHRHGVLHADLKPENVVLAGDGRLRVVDFGLARLVGVTSPTASGTPAYMAPELWRSGAPTEAIDVWALGVMVYEMVVGRRPFADLQLFGPAPPKASWPLEAPPALQELIDRCLQLEPGARPSADEVRSGLASLCAPAPSEGEKSQAPFRGLLAFGEDEHADYFGREREVAACAQLVRQHALVPVVGPSGIGKTSFVVAGLLPRLRESARWKLLQLRPGARPLSALATALGDPALASRLAAEPGLAAGKVRLASAEASAPVLLFVDQLEELFTLATPGDAAAFSACLAAASLDSDDPWRVVVAVRDDFLGSVARLPALAPSLGAAVVLGPVSPAGLEAAITEPLRRVGYQLEPPALAGRIARELHGTAAALPLLQFTCAALWERRDTARRLLPERQYDALGGATGALASHAEQLVSRLQADEVRRLRATLLALVNLDGTRRPRRRQALVELDAEAASIVDELIRHRLVVSRRDPETDEAMVELAHEALATEWPRLREWLAETHEQRALVRQLEEAASLWARRGERETETWVGDALTQAVHRLHQWGARPGGVVGRFLEASEQRQRRARRARRLAVGAVIATLAAATATATVVAAEFRRREQVAVAQQDEIRLAAADTGQFDLVLRPWGFDAETQQVTAARGSSFTVVLHRADPAGGALTGVKQTALDGGADGLQAIRLEAPAGPVMVEIERPGCAASWLFLKRLPGYAERRPESQPRIELWVPTCGASLAAVVPIAAGPWWQPRELADGGIGDEEATLPAFGLDALEVSNAAFEPFERMRPLTGAPHLVASQPAVLAEARGPRFPVTGVDAPTAEAYCRYLGKRLPTAAEWQKAARGGRWLDAASTRENAHPTRWTPWASGPATAANLAGADDGVAGVAPVGTMPLDVSPYGVRDLGGNVSEWTATPMDSNDPEGLRHALGGNWAKPAQHELHALVWRDSHAPGYSDFALGFRCASP